MWVPGILEDGCWYLNAKEGVDGLGSAHVWLQFSVKFP